MHGLQQLTREPTRLQYTLDLVLTDIPGSEVKVGPYIADHKLLMASIPIPEIISLPVAKKSFDLKKARWKDLEKALANHDWEGLREGSCEDAAILFMTVLWTYLCSYIPFREVKTKKKSHPWLNKKCETAILAKNNAQEGIDFEEKRRYCSQVLTEEYQSYVEVLKQKIADLKKGSKEWWKLNRELLNRKNK